MDITANTVSAVNQMIKSSDLSFLGNENAKKRILIVGNSITRHGPKEDIGWSGDWGMAASAPEKDYVHRLHTMLTDANEDVYIRIRQCAFWERNYLNEDILSNYVGEKDFCADIVVFRLGENVPAELKPAFQQKLEEFINYICPKSGKVIFTTCFWANEIVDDAIKAVASARGDVCLNGNFAVDEKMMALGKFEHSGVAAHPSDEGMEAIANSIFEAIQKL